jgi:hypothetical protein
VQRHLMSRIHIEYINIHNNPVIFSNAYCHGFINTKEVSSLLIVQNFTMLESRCYTSHLVDGPINREQAEIGSV